MQLPSIVFYGHVDTLTRLKMLTRDDLSLNIMRLPIAVVLPGTESVEFTDCIPEAKDLAGDMAHIHGCEYAWVS